MLIPLGFLSASGAGGGGSYELISSTILSSTAAISFSSIDQTYKHLQLRIVSRMTDTGGSEPIYTRLNGNTGISYVRHSLGGGGSSVNSTYTAATDVFRITTSGAGAPANAYGVAIVDILDYTNTSKNKTLRWSQGYWSSGADISLNSGLYLSTSAITSIQLQSIGLGFAAGSRVSLYGIKG